MNAMFYHTDSYNQTIKLLLLDTTGILQIVTDMEYMLVSIQMPPSSPTYYLASNGMFQM